MAMRCGYSWWCPPPCPTICGECDGPPSKALEVEFTTLADEFAGSCDGQCSLLNDVYILDPVAPISGSTCTWELEVDIPFCPNAFVPSPFPQTCNFTAHLIRAKCQGTTLFIEIHISADLTPPGCSLTGDQANPIEYRVSVVGQEDYSAWNALEVAFYDSTEGYFTCTDSGHALVTAVDP